MPVTARPAPPPAVGPARSTVPLPPGQRDLGFFPRFGRDLSSPPPEVPDDAAIAVTGAVVEPVSVPVTDLADLPRRTQLSDFHCVAGWSARDLEWEGVPFRAFYDAIVAPRLRPGPTPTHLTFRGLDGVSEVLEVGDVLADDVLLADHLHGAPLGGDHGAPVRLVSPRQYGYLNVKHLCRIEVHTARPARRRGALELLLQSHPRARVSEEERHGTVPGRVIRPVYDVIRRIAFRGALRRPDDGQGSAPLP